MSTPKFRRGVPRVVQVHQLLSMGISLKVGILEVIMSLDLALVLHGQDK